MPEMSKHARFLLADADAGRRARLRELLETGADRVEEAGSPEEAIAAARERRPDLVIAGVAHAEALLGLPRSAPASGLSPGLQRAVPVLLIGAPGEEGACLGALEHGAADFLIEPLDGRELRARAAARLREGAERRAAAEREEELDAEAWMAGETLEWRKATQEALRESEERFRLATEAISGLVYDWDVVRDSASRSPGLKSLLGYLPEEVDHQVGWWTSQIHPEDFPAAERRIWGAIAGDASSYSAEYRMRHRDGHWVHVWDRGFIVRDATGRPVRVVGSTVDITDRKRAEEELRAANEAKDRFLATLSHELRTPLTPVLALVSSLEEDPRLPAALRGDLAVVRRNVELEARLIDDLLDLTRVARGKLELHHRATDVREILRHTLENAERGLVGKRLRLLSDLEPADHRVWGDAPRLTQVFWNLLQNAVKFTPDGGKIAVRSRRLEGDAGAELAIEIIDTGIGIEPEGLPRIFDAFEQADRRITRRFGGLGLGLAVSRAIVRLHGGELTAASGGRDRGATFTVRLPAGLPERPERDPDETFARFRSAAPSDTVHLRLLLVEDHPDTADALADLLRDRGHEVTVARNVAEGLAAAAAVNAAETGGAFDLVISDVGLPDGSGLDLMRGLAERHGLRGIALSGYGMEEDVQRSREAGFLAHLTKPVDVQALLAAILDAAGALRR
jgi:PAS domain S-box-containing protein